MDNENQRRFESVYSKKVRAGKRRTYFFDVRRTKGDDYYLTLTESTKRFNGDGYERHKIFLYKEDFNRFLASLEEVITHVKTELMPDYDYDEYTRRHEEYEARRAAGEFDLPQSTETTVEPTATVESTETTVEPTEPAAANNENATSSEAPAAEAPSTPVESEDDMSW